jgi:hypothetical protein
MVITDETRSRKQERKLGSAPRLMLLIAAVSIGVVALMLASVAAAHRGDGVFTLAEGRGLGGDVAMLPDGSIVGVVPSSAWRLTPDGTRTSIPGLGGTGVTATPDGGVLVIQGGVLEPFPGAFEDGSGPLAVHRVVRWTPSGGVSVAAGTGEAGFAGDGGPASEALLNLGPRPLSSFIASPATGIVARASGSFVFADTRNRRIRAVDATGTIRTIAGGSAGTFHDPVGLAATPDGGYLVTEAYAGRVRRVRSAGAIEDVAALSAQDVVVLPDGAAVMAAFDGRLWRLEPGSRTPRPYLRRSRPTEPFDFAARSTFGWAIGPSSDGGLVIVGDRVVKYVSAGPTPWALAALRGTHPDPRGVTAVIEATAPGIATLEIVRDGRIVASVTEPVMGGHSTLRALGPIRSDWYDVRLQLEGAERPTARDEVPIHGARALTLRLARGLLGRNQGRESDSETRYTLGRDCRRFGQRRADCVIETRAGCPVGVASVTLRRSGVVLRRDYRRLDRPCAPPRFRRNPRFIGSHGLRRLSRNNGGTWSAPWE